MKYYTIKEAAPDKEQLPFLPIMFSFCLKVIAQQPVTSNQ
jgi:hypothetical protein